MARQTAAPTFMMTCNIHTLSSKPALRAAQVSDVVYTFELLHPVLERAGAVSKATAGAKARKDQETQEQEQEKIRTNRNLLTMTVRNN